MVLVCGFDCKLLCMVLSIFSLSYKDVFNYFLHLQFDIQRVQYSNIIYSLLCFLQKRDIMGLEKDESEFTL